MALPRVGDTARQVPACTNFSAKWNGIRTELSNSGRLLTMTLSGGHGTSAKLNAFVANSVVPPPLSGPAIVDSSPGEKVSIVDEMTGARTPQESWAYML